MAVATAILAPELSTRLSAVQIDGAPTWSTLGAHRIRYAALAYFERGTTRVALNGIEQRFSVGDIVYVPTGTTADTDRAFENQRSTWWSVAFDGASDGTVHLGSPTQRLLNRLAGIIPVDRTCGIGRISIPTSDRRAWSERFHRLRYELARGGNDSHEVVNALLTLIAVDGARLGGSRRDERVASPLLERLFHYITTNIDQTIGLREAAQALAFSPSYLTEMLRRDTGRSVCEWILEVRLRRAEELLLDRNLTVSDVASAVGYDDARSFRRAFSRVRGVAPNAWRSGRESARFARPRRAETIIRDRDGFRTGSESVASA